MSGLVLTHENGDVALVSLAGPSGNALTAAMRAALAQALGQIFTNDAIRAIVLQGMGDAFCAGSDLSELGFSEFGLSEFGRSKFGGPPKAPQLRDLCSLVEDAPKPVICALHGMAIGGGVELALAAHGRVAQRGTRLSIPDIRLSMIPGAGATQRLPRLLGAQRAAAFLLSGQSVMAENGRLKGMFQRITPGPPQEAAIALARAFADRGDERGGWPRTRDVRRGFSDPRVYAASIATLRAQVPSDAGAAQDMLRAIEAAPLFPFAQGLALEAALFEDRLKAPDCRAARHALLCERQASLTQPGLIPEALVRVTIIGAGPVACRIAAMLLETRSGVSLCVPPGQSEDAARDDVARLFPADLSEAARVARLQRLRLQEGPASLTEADFVLDSGAGGVALPNALKPGVIWAGLAAGPASDVSPGAFSGRVAGMVAPGRVVTLCLYPPVARGGVGEISCDGQTDPQSLANLQAYFAGLDIRLIRTTLGAGALGHRMRMSLHSGASLLVALGADPYAVDAAARSLGFAAGPFRDMDAEGLEIAVRQLAHVAQSRGLVDVSQGMLQALCDKGRTGLKCGRGVYIYGESGAMPDPALPALRQELALGDAAAGMDRDALASALLGAVVNEAARLLGEGTAARAGDLDLLTLGAMGVARSAGGLLFQADLRGMFHVYKAMRGLSDLSNLWVPHERIEVMVKNGQGFFGRSVVRGPVSA